MTSIHMADGRAHAITASLRRTQWAGTAIAGAFFIGFGAWAALAPLSGAALAPGVISPDGNRRTVQHLEGGIVSELLVRDGSSVEAGQPLVVLESGIARASQDALRKELQSNLANHWRLIAERNQASVVDFPADELDIDAPEIRALLDAQRALFESRREARETRLAILQERIGQLGDEIVGLKAQIASQTTQLRLIRDEAKGVAALVEKGYERRARLLALQRSEAEIAGMRAGSQAAIAKATSAIGETRAQMDSVVTQHMEEVETQLNEGAAKIAGIREKLKAASDVVQRTVVHAPVSGTVVELRVRTIGGVITAGQAILDIVPRDEELLIDARVQPNDIDEVRAGLSARIVLTGYKQRNLPHIEGKVRDVSADRILDPRTGQTYYLAHVTLPAMQVRQVIPQAELKPGMPAEVMVMTGERTLLDYLTEPLATSLRRSFRES